MSQRQDEWLITRARGGDHAAFDKLTEKYDARIRGMERNFIPDTFHDRDDLHQIALTAVWIAMRRHRPSAGKFEHFLSKVIADELGGSLRARLAAKRWAGRGNMCSLNTSGPDGGEMEFAAPSWAFGANPAHVVVYRDELRRAWLSLKASNREAVNEWLRANPGELPYLTHKAANTAQRAARAIIDSPDGIAPDCSSRRRCEACSGRLPAGMKRTTRYCSPTCQSVAWTRGPDEAREARRAA